jgi:DNA-binding CsgD family transcriptional regulator
MAMPVTSSLFGRETETQSLDDLLDHVRDRGGSLVVSGEPGVGKSALLEEASTRARGRGMLVLAATGVPFEAQLPFAGLQRLLRPILGQADGLPAPQRHALHAAFGMTDAAVPDLFLAALAVLNLLAERAGHSPVLVVADDAHWLDRSTSDVLAFVARRLEFEPILLLTGIRDGFESPFSDAELPSLHLEALLPRAAATLLDSRAPGLPAAARERLLDEAAGNPLALVELPATLEHTTSGASLPTWLPLSTRLEQAFTARVCDLPAETRTALLVAALSDSTLLHEVLEATALMTGSGPTADIMTPAVAERLVEIDDAEFRFRHPLMRTAIYQAASVSQRYAAHSALANILSGQPDRRVWHRAASTIGQDENVADELEAAAEQARRRGATAAAVSALQRAASLGDDRARIGRLLRAAQLAFELGRHDLAVELLEKVEPLDLRPAERARVVWIRQSIADGILGDAASAHSLATIADRAGADGNADLAAKLLCAAALRCLWADPGQAARDHIVSAAERLDVDGSDPRLLVIRGRAAPIGQGATVIGQLPRRMPEGTDAHTLRLVAMAAMAVGAFDVAAELFATSTAGLRAQGRLALLARMLALQAWSNVQLADLSAAIPAAEEGARLAQETHQPLFMAMAQAVQAWLAALRGDQEAAATLAARAERVGLPRGASSVLATAKLARGLAALGSGLPADALQHLRCIHDPADPAYDAALGCWTIGDLAEAARRSGSRDGIRVYMDEMETAAKQTPSPLLHAGLSYARALLADDAEAGLLFEAVLESDMNAWPFLRARTQLAYGEWLHQQRRNVAARMPLRAARETFDALGVNPWSERVRQLLRATGEASRPRTPEARDRLSPQELHIAQLAAEGLTNREIGQKLYLSPRTVSSHLYRAYPKLGITSRIQLGAALKRKDPG